MFSSILGLGLILAAASCDGKESGPVEVKGTVAFQGSPLPAGSLLFRPDDKEVPVEGAQIANGKFTIKVKPGSYTVEIIASKKMPLPAGVFGPLGETESMQNYIPEKYNAQSELKQVITKATSISIDMRE